MSWRPSFRFIDVALSLALVGCGGGGLPPVDVPADFAADPAVRALIAERIAAVTADPASAAAHFDLGLALSVNGGEDLAARSLEQAIELDGKLADGHYQLSKLHAKRGDVPAQIASLRRAIECSADLAAAHYALAWVHLEEGQLDEAEAEFQRVHVLVPKSPLGQLGLGLVALERDALQEGVELLTRVREQVPKNSFVRLQLGQAYARMGDEARAAHLLAGIAGSAERPRARSASDRKAELFQVSSAARLAAANELLNAGAHARALPILERLHRESPNSFEVAMSLVAAHVQARRPGDAVTVLKAADALRPNHHLVALQRATCALQLAEQRIEAKDAAGVRNQLTRALEWADLAIATSKDLGKAHARRGAALAGLRRDGDAMAAYRRAIELGETDESLYLDMLGPARRYGGPNLALSVLSQGIGAGPDRIRLRFELCGVLLGEGRGRDARKEHRKMTRLAPQHRLTKSADLILTQRGF